MIPSKARGAPTNTGKHVRKAQWQSAPTAWGTDVSYIYKGDRTSSAVHTVVGHVTEGIELIRIAQAGSRLAVISNPERVMILGMGFAQAEKMLEARGLKLEKHGYTGDDAIIVEQDPKTNH